MSHSKNNSYFNLANFQLKGFHKMVFQLIMPNNEHTINQTCDILLNDCDTTNLIDINQRTIIIVYQHNRT